MLLSPAALAADLSVRDLTDPAQGPHAVQLVIDEVVAALAGAWDCPVEIVRTHPVTSTEDNYDRLGYAPDAVARDTRYSRYVSETCLLRRTRRQPPPPSRRTCDLPAPVQQERDQSVEVRPRHSPER